METASFFTSLIDGQPATAAELAALAFAGHAHFTAMQVRGGRLRGLDLHLQRLRQASLELYAQAFDNVGALDKLEAFASFHGADFYGLPRNSGTVTLKRESWTVPETVPYGEATLKPLCGGEQLAWKLQ